MGGRNLLKYRGLDESSILHLSFSVLFDALVYVCKSEKYKKVEGSNFNLMSEH